VWWYDPEFLDAALKRLRKAFVEDRGCQPKDDADLVAWRKARGCFNCEKTESKRWRTGPDGPSTLCDTCGTYFSKHKKHRPEHIFLKDKWRVRADQSAG
jgi:hypothetical protein